MIPRLFPHFYDPPPPSPITFEFQTTTVPIGHPISDHNNPSSAMHNEKMNKTVIVRSMFNIDKATKPLKMSSILYQGCW